MLTLLDPSLINKLKLDALSNLVYREFDLAKNCDHQHSPPQND